jgi:hypothetical protein
MNSRVGQRLWKSQLVAGLLTIVVGVMVLAWPGPSILVAATLFGVYVLMSGLVELHLAFTLPRSTETRVLLFISGALSLIFAVSSFRHFGDGYAVLLLSLFIEISFIFHGISGVAAGIGESACPATAGTSSSASRPCSPASRCWHGHLGPPASGWASSASPRSCKHSKPTRPPTSHAERWTKYQNRMATALSD